MPLPQIPRSPAFGGGWEGGLFERLTQQRLKQTLGPRHHARKGNKLHGKHRFLLSCRFFLDVLHTFEIFEMRILSPECGIVILGSSQDNTIGHSQL